MAKAYYSTVFEQPADMVWGQFRDFNNYGVWVEGAGAAVSMLGQSDGAYQ